jgi:hypothetical protein
MRPKHALWLFVAILWSAWFFVDPEARELIGTDSSHHSAEHSSTTVQATRGRFLTQHF